MNFIKPVIKQESSLHNQHSWGKYWGNKLFHILLSTLLITKSGWLTQKQQSKKSQAFAEMLFTEEIWI